MSQGCTMAMPVKDLHQLQIQTCWIINFGRHCRPGYMSPEKRDLDDQSLETETNHSKLLKHQNSSSEDLSHEPREDENQEKVTDIENDNSAQSAKELNESAGSLAASKEVEKNYDNASVADNDKNEVENVPSSEENGSLDKEEAETKHSECSEKYAKKAKNKEEKDSEIEDKNAALNATAPSQKTFVFGQGFKLPTFGSLQSKTIDDLIEENSHKEETVSTDASFEAKEIVTGEEDEETLWSARGKLFSFEENEWKEKGIGLLKLNQNTVNKISRFIMRTDGSYRLILNSPIFKDFAYELLQGKNLRFGVIEDAKPLTLLFRGKIIEDMQSFETVVKKVLKTIS